MKLQKEIFEDFLLSIKIFFKKEEQEYIKHSHPDTEIHTSVHQEFIRAISSFFYEYTHMEIPDKNYYTNMIMYIKNWLTDHIETMDRDMEPFMRISEYVSKRAVPCL